MMKNLALLVAVWAAVAVSTPVSAQRGAGAPGAPQGDPEAGLTATRPPLLFAETWKEPAHTAPLTDAERRVSQVVLSNPDLELKLYGPDAAAVSVNPHEGRLDLWNGSATSPIAVTLRHKTNYLDLSGLARVRWILRTGSLHVIHPVLKLADGTLIAGTHVDDTDGVFLQSEIAFGNQRWFKLDPAKIVTTTPVMNPDLKKVDEIGWVDLAPGGGRGAAGWANMSTIEVYAKGVPR
jgi:hypothetical protein